MVAGAALAAATALTLPAIGTSEPSEFVRAWSADAWIVGTVLSAPRVTAPAPTATTPVPTPTPSPIAGQPSSAFAPDRLPEAADVVSASIPGLALDDLLEDLAAAADTASPGVDAAISVVVDGQQHGVWVGADPVVHSASTAKMYWVVAAVAAVGLDPVAPSAPAIFAWSDNSAAGRVIDLVGIDEINAWTRSLGLDDTYLSAWAYDRGRFASDRAELGTANTTSASDAAQFLDLLVGGELLSPAETEQVLEWMRLAPEADADPTVYGSVLVTDLDPSVASQVAHKAGWLPPGCCTSVDNVLLSAGVIPLPDGSSYTIAVTTTDGSSYTGQAAWIASTVAAIDALLRHGT